MGLTTWPIALPQPGLYTNIATVTEVVLPNGGEGATYTPLPGRPGFDANFQPTYNITSDSHSELPEPAV
jgi:hypothetical protein